MPFLVALFVFDICKYMHCVVILYEFYEPSQVYINVLVQPTKALFSPVAEGCRALFPLSSSFPGFKDHIACDIITLMLFHFISLLIFHEFHTSMDIPKDYFLAWTCLYYYLISFFSSVSVPAVILYKLTFKLFRYGLLRLCLVTGNPALFGYGMRTTGLSGFVIFCSS